MSMGAEYWMGEIVPYLGLDQPNRVPISYGGTSDAPLLAAGCAAAVSLRSSFVSPLQSPWTEDARRASAA